MRKSILFFVSLLLADFVIAQEYTATIISKPSNATFRYVDNSPTDAGINAWANGMIIADWTSGGTPYVWRSLLKFSLSSVPAGSTIDSAFIFLYANPTSPSGNPGSPTWGTDNAVGIYRLTGAWDTTTLIWSTQPAYTTVHGDTLPQSTSTTEDYINVNVTALVKDAYTLGNYGFLFKHIQETTPLNSMIFYSPYEYSIDSAKTPKLVIKYKNKVGVTNVNDAAETMDIYPNPSNSFVNIDIMNVSGKTVDVLLKDITGRVLVTRNINNQVTRSVIGIDLSGYAPGLYFVCLQNANGIALTKKLLIN